MVLLVLQFGNSGSDGMMREIAAGELSTWVKDGGFRVTVGYYFDLGLVFWMATTD